jgi:RNA polymerase sigma-70 factor (ECF subfamily)
MVLKASAARFLAGAGGLADTRAPTKWLGRPTSAGSYYGGQPSDPKMVRISSASSQMIGIATSMLSDDAMMAQRFKETVMPYLNDAYTLARYLTRNSQDAEDVVQDAYLRAFKFFGTFKGNSARPWLLAIVRNCFYSWLKTRPRGNTASLTDIDLDDVDTTSVVSDLWTPNPIDPERALITLNDAETIRALIEGLPTQFRETLVLREMDELSYQEIADITEVPIGTVMSRLARARQLFKAAWLEHQEKERRS